MVVPTACRVGSIQLRLRRDRWGRLIAKTMAVRSRRKGSWIDPTRHAVGTTISLLISLHIERCAPDHLERDKVAVHRVRVSGHVDVNPVLDCSNPRRLCYWGLEVHRV